MRITGNDPEGQDQLGNFIDPEAKYPVLVTTSRLLSTGVDAQTCRLIVIDREVGSMTEFKQIVGRGTRVHDDTKKYFFTLMDFRKATNQFADPNFDGPPVQIYEAGEEGPVAPPEDPAPPEPGEGEAIIDEPLLPPFGGGDDGGPKKYYIKGKPVSVATERVEYLDEQGKLVTESLRDYTKKAIRKRFASLNEFLTVWKATARKQAVIEELANEGLLLEPLLEEVGKDLDPFDLICHVAFDRPPLTRRERVNNVRKRDVFAKYGVKARAVLEALLQKYQDEGFTNLDDLGVLKVVPFSTLGTPLELLKPFGCREGFETAARELQAALYQEVA
jgi:type I restriction enzyme, R subunit